MTAWACPHHRAADISSRSWPLPASKQYLNEGQGTISQKGMSKRQIHDRVVTKLYTTGLGYLTPRTKHSFMRHARGVALQQLEQLLWVKCPPQHSTAQYSIALIQPVPAKAAVCPIPTHIVMQQAHL